MDRRDEGRLRPEYLATLPALVAASVGVVYATGAIVRAAELEEAGVAAADAFPLIPIEQHLARGIQVLVSPEAIGFYVGLLVCSVLALLITEGLEGVVNRASKRWPGLRRWKLPPAGKSRVIAWCALGLVLIGTLVVRPLLLVLIILEGIILYAALRLTEPPTTQLELSDRRPAEERFSLRERLRRRRLGRGTLLLMIATAVILVAGANALVYPRSLPCVELEKKSGVHVEGRLITVADQTWYLGLKGDNHPLTAIPFDVVASSRVTQVEDDDASDDPLFDLTPE
jgi:hypothetical protein